MDSDCSPIRRNQTMPLYQEGDTTATSGSLLDQSDFATDSQNEQLMLEQVLAASRNETQSNQTSRRDVEEDDLQLALQLSQQVPIKPNLRALSVNQIKNATAIPVGILRDDVHAHGQGKSKDDEDDIQKAIRLSLLESQNNQTHLQVESNLHESHQQDSEEVIEIEDSQSQEFAGDDNENESEEVNSQTLESLMEEERIQLAIKMSQKETAKKTAGPERSIKISSQFYESPIPSPPKIKPRTKIEPEQMQMPGIAITKPVKSENNHDTKPDDSGIYDDYGDPIDLTHDEELAKAIQEQMNRECEEQMCDRSEDTTKDEELAKQLAAELSAGGGSAADVSARNNLTEEIIVCGHISKKNTADFLTDEQIAKRLKEQLNQCKVPSSVTTEKESNTASLHKLKEDECMAKQLQKEMNETASDVGGHIEVEDDEIIAKRLQEEINQQSQYHAKGEGHVSKGQDHLDEDEMFARTLQESFNMEVSVADTTLEDEKLARELQEAETKNSEFTSISKQTRVTPSGIRTKVQAQKGIHFGSFGSVFGAGDERKLNRKFGHRDSSESQLDREALSRHFMAEFNIAGDATWTPGKKPSTSQQLADYRQAQRDRHPRHGAATSSAPHTITRPSSEKDTSVLGLASKHTKGIAVNKVSTSPGVAGSPVGLPSPREATRSVGKALVTSTPRVGTATCTPRAVLSPTPRSLNYSNTSSPKVGTASPVPQPSTSRDVKSEPVLVLGDDECMKTSMATNSSDCYHDSKVDCGAENLQSSQDTKDDIPFSNVTCGSCRQKGHTRNSKLCPKYYTEDEMKRREKTAEGRKRKADEKEKEKEEALSTLQVKEREIQQAINDIDRQRERDRQERERQLRDIQQALQTVKKTVEKTKRPRKK